MLTERRMHIRKPNITGAVAGYDLGSQYAQISYCLPGTDKPETVSSVAGQEEYLIPALLARSIDSHNWLFGREAQEAVQKGEAYPVKELLSSAAAKKTIQVEEESFDSIALLSLFIRKTLTLLTPILPSNKLQGFVFSVEKVTGEIAESLKQAVILLELKVDQVFVIGRAESFFYYNISQPEELWLRDVLLCDLSRDVLRTYLFHANRKTTPVASFVDETVQEEVQPFIPTGDEAQDHRNGMKLDRKFAAVVSEILDMNQVSSVYLIGSGFEGEWYQESLPILCKDRRVFLGNNLFSKGACYAAMERLFGGISKGYAFLGNDMIQANVGMCVQRRGSDAYLALLDAGTNWYEAKAECDFLLEEEASFSLRITPINGKDVREVVLTLSGLPKRPPRTTRIHMKLEMKDVRQVRISMEDIGFGEFYPATHKFWEESFELTQQE